MIYIFYAPFEASKNTGVAGQIFKADLSVHWSHLSFSRGVGGGVLRYFHTYVGSGHFLGSIFEFQYFWGFSEK